MMPAKQIISQQLRDIKPPVEIHDISVYLYWGLIVLAAIVLVVAAFFLICYLLGLRRINQRRAWCTALKQINWNDPKKSAYEATRLGRLLLGDSDRLEELYRQMVTELEAYKYKREVDPLSPEARAQFDLFLKACDESL